MQRKAIRPLIYDVLNSSYDARAPTSSKMAASAAPDEESNKRPASGMSSSIAIDRKISMEPAEKFKIERMDHWAMYEKKAIKKDEIKKIEREELQKKEAKLKQEEAEYLSMQWINSKIDRL